MHVHAVDVSQVSSCCSKRPRGIGTTAFEGGRRKRSLVLWEFLSASGSVLGPFANLPACTRPKARFSSAVLHVMFRRRRIWKSKILNPPDFSTCKNFCTVARRPPTLLDIEKSPAQELPTPLFEASEGTRGCPEHGIILQACRTALAEGLVSQVAGRALRVAVGKQRCKQKRNTLARPSWS